MRCFEGGPILAVHEERQLARLRFLDSGDAGDFKTGVAFEFAAELLGELSQFHDGFSSWFR